MKSLLCPKRTDGDPLSHFVAGTKKTAPGHTDRRDCSHACDAMSVRVCAVTPPSTGRGMTPSRRVCSHRCRWPFRERGRSRCRAQSRDEGRRGAWKSVEGGQRTGRGQPEHFLWEKPHAARARGCGRWVPPNAVGGPDLPDARAARTQTLLGEAKHSGHLETSLFIAAEWGGLLLREVSLLLRGLRSRRGAHF